MAVWRIVAGAAAMAAMAAAAPANAQAGARASDRVATESGARVVEALTRCRAIAAPDARLDCFDKAAGTLEAAVRARDVRIVDRQDIRKARRSLFGFTLPRVGLFGGGENEQEAKEEAFTQIDSTIVSARAVQYDRVELRIAEGDAVWRTTDPMQFPPRAGKKIRIRQGALGNYFINVEGERPVRGMRLR